VEPLTHVIITAVAAAGAGLAAAATYADQKRPHWLGVAVVLTIAATLWGMYAVLTVALDDLVWRLDLLRTRTGP
jgi:hypothetical protein